MINIARDFSPFAAGRYDSDGPWSGQKFREKFLKPALSKFDKVVVDLDGTLGLGSSFLEESFGGLVRVEGFDKDVLKNKLEIVCKQSSYINKIWKYISDANPAK